MTPEKAMAQDIKITVVVGTYNHGKYVGQCVKSILDQTYTNLELIVIDDGSTDNTREVLKPYADSIRYVYQENLGRAAAKNHGIELAASDWIAIVGADDLWEPDKLARQVAAIEKYPQIDLISTNSSTFNDEGVVAENFFDKMRLMFEVPAITDGSIRVFSERLFPLFIVENFINESSVLVRKKCFMTEGLYDSFFKRCQDRDMWMRLSRKYTFACIDEVLVRTRVNSLGDGPGTDQPIVFRIKALEKALERDTEWERKYRRQLLRQIGRNHFELGYFYYRQQRDLRKYRYHLGRSISCGHRPIKIYLQYLSTFLPISFHYYLWKSRGKR